MNNPEYVKIGTKKYKINTDFRVAIKCNNISKDNSAGEYEKCLAIIYMLYGDEGLNNPKDYDRLLKLGQKYLLCDKDIEKADSIDVDMDYVQDMDYIEASFMSDYKIDLANIKMHWWTFSKLIDGLSNSELGNCCILNRVRNLRNYDVSKIKDQKEREKIIQAQKRVVLKKKEVKLTKEQEESMRRINQMIFGKK